MVLALVILVIATSAPAVHAGDNVSFLLFEPDSIEAAPGETVDVSLEMRSHGGYGGVGVAAITVTIGFDPDVIEVLELERGPWLVGDEEADVEVVSTIDEERGNATIEQARDPDAGGTTGTDVLVDLRLRIDDEGTGNTTLEVVETAVTLENGYPQPTLERSATIVIGDDAAATGETGAATQDGVVGTDGQPGFGLLLAVIASGAGVRWLWRSAER